MSALVGYSSGEEDSQHRRQPDTNYDDVTMDMSDDNGDNSDKAEAEGNNSDSKSEDKSHSDKDVHKEGDCHKEAGRHAAQPSRTNRRSPVRHGDEDRRHRQKHKHHRKRSRSRERRRRSRSRDHERRGHHRHPNNLRRDVAPNHGRREHEERQDARSRKLLALGIVSSQAALVSQAGRSEASGIEVPKYYNPAAINPVRYADQIKKRQMLWGGGGKKAEEAASEVAEPPLEKASFNKWESTNFGDSQANEKFRRLMGIKAPSAASSTASVANPASEGTAKWFADQEKQYERARAITHTQRGLGLGFSDNLAQGPAGSVDGQIASGNSGVPGLKK